MLMAIKLLRVHLQTRAMLPLHRIQLRPIHLAHLIAQVRRTVRQAVPMPRTKLPQAIRRQRVTQPPARPAPQTRLPIRPRAALAPTQHPQIRLPHPRIHRRLPAPRAATPLPPIALRQTQQVPQTPQIPPLLLIQMAAEEDSSPLLLLSISTFMKLHFSN